MLVAKVALNQKTRQADNLFDYRITSQLLPDIKPGQIIRVDFGGKNHLGLLTKIQRQKASHYKLKPIKKIICPSYIAQPWQLKLAKLISQQYAVTFGQAFFSLLPPLTQTANKGLSFTKDRPSEYTYQEQYVIGGKRERWQRFVKLAQTEPTIIVFSEILQAKLFHQKFLPQAQIYYSQLGKTQLTKIFLSAQKGRLQTVVGTLSALFLPLKNCRQIILDDFLSEIYLKDNSPKYEVVPVSRQIAQLRKLSLILADASYPLLSKTPSTLDQREISFQFTPDFLGVLEQKVLGFDSNLIFYPFNEGIEKYFRRLSPVLPQLKLVSKDTTDFLLAKNILGTSRLLSFPWPKFSAIHIVLPEFLLNQASYYQNEKLYYLIHKLASYCQGPIFFYTNQRKVIRKLRMILQSHFSQQELGLRKKYLFPPFAEFVEIKCPLARQAQDKAKNLGYNIIKKEGNQLLIKIAPGQILDYAKIYPCRLKRNLKTL